MNMCTVNTSSYGDFNVSKMYNEEWPLYIHTGIYIVFKSICINVCVIFVWQLLLTMAFFNAGTGGSVYVVRLRHMYLLRMEDQGITICAVLTLLSLWASQPQLHSFSCISAAAETVHLKTTKTTTTCKERYEIQTPKCHHCSPCLRSSV